MYLSILVLILYFFLNTYNIVSIATSWSVSPIATTSKMIPLNISLANSNMFLLPPPRCLSCHLKDISLSTSRHCSFHLKTSLLPPPRGLSCHHQDVSLATSRRHSCHVQDVDLSTFKMSLFPRSRRHSFDLQYVCLSTSNMSLLRRLYGVWKVKSEMTCVVMKCHNKDEIYVIRNATSCETTFEGVHCFSFSQKYKVAIASNTPSEFDPNVLVYVTLLAHFLCFQLTFCTF
jgi:hypothetical protein